MPTEKDSKLYEIAYILDGRLAEEKAGEKAGDLKGLIESAHNMTVEESAPKLRRLAYAIRGQNEAFFGWIKFIMQPSEINTVYGKIKKIPEVLRFLLVEAQREEIMEKRIKQKRRVMTEEERARIDEIDKKLEEILG